MSRSFVDDLDENELADVLGAQTRETKRPAAPEPEKGPAYAPLIGSHLEDLWTRQQQPIDAVPTMWPKWNFLCGGKGGREGLARGWNVLFAAPPGTMKSIFACNLAVAAAFAGERVTFHSLEMDWDDNAVRTLAILSDTEVWKLEPGKGFDREAARKATQAAHRLREKTGGMIDVNRDVVSTLPELRDSITRRYEVHGSRFQIVDYFQIVGLGSGRWDDILARVTEVSYTVRVLAKTLQIVAVGLSQLVREAIRMQQRPTAQDLMGGSPLENDAHQVLIFDPTRYKRVDDGWTGWAAVVKNRHGDKGETADVPIHFNRRTLQIRERESWEVPADEYETDKPKRRRNG